MIIEVKHLIIVTKILWCVAMVIKTSPAYTFLSKATRASATTTTVISDISCSQHQQNLVRINITIQDAHIDLSNIYLITSPTYYPARNKSHDCNTSGVTRHVTCIISDDDGFLTKRIYVMLPMVTRNQTEYKEIAQFELKTSECYSRNDIVKHVALKRLAKTRHVINVTWNISQWWLKYINKLKLRQQTIHNNLDDETHEITITQVSKMNMLLDVIEGTEYEVCLRAYYYLSSTPSHWTCATTNFSHSPNNISYSIINHTNNINRNSTTYLIVLITCVIVGVLLVTILVTWCVVWKIREKRESNILRHYSVSKRDSFIVDNELLNYVPPLQETIIDRDFTNKHVYTTLQIHHKTNWQKILFWEI